LLLTLATLTASRQVGLSAASLLIVGAALKARHDETDYLLLQQRASEPKLATVM